jgi:hypothetical protein
VLQKTKGDFDMASLATMFLAYPSDYIALAVFPLLLITGLPVVFGLWEGFSYSLNQKLYKQEEQRLFTMYRRILFICSSGYIALLVVGTLLISLAIRVPHIHFSLWVYSVLCLISMMTGVTISYIFGEVWRLCFALAKILSTVLFVYSQQTEQENVDTSKKSYVTKELITQVNSSLIVRTIRKRH